MKTCNPTLSQGRLGGTMVMLWLLLNGAAARAEDYTWIAAPLIPTGTLNWVDSTNWSPNAPAGGPATGDNIFFQLNNTGTVNMVLGGNRTVNSLTKLAGSRRWDILGTATTPATITAHTITSSASSGTMVFRNGTVSGGLLVQVVDINVAGSLGFGSTSNSGNNSIRGLNVTGTTTVTAGSLILNVVDGADNAYQLGLLNVSGTGIVYLNNYPTGGTKTSSIANITGLNGAGGTIYTSNTTGTVTAVLAITNTQNYSSGTAIRNANGASPATLSLSKSGAGTQILTGTNTYTGTTTIHAGTLQFGKQVSLYNNTLASWTAENLMVNSGATAAFNVGGTGEFTSADLDALLAVGTATGGFKDGARVGLDTTNESGGSFTYGSIIANSNSGANAIGLTKLGAGTLSLTGINTYSGATLVSAGVLSIAADSALGTAPVTATTGHLTLNGGTLATTATFALDSNRGISLGASGGTVDVAANTTLTYGGIAADVGTLTKAGAGTLILSGVNTYSGSTTVNAGVLSIAADSGLGTAPGAATPAQLTLNDGTLATTTDMTLASTRGLSLGASGGTLDVAASTTLSYDGSIAGAGSLTKAGTGTLALSGANSYTSTTNVNAGTLAISNNTALGTTAGGVTVASGASLQISGGITVGAEALNLTGDGAVANLGALVSSGGANTWAGDITVGAATRINASSGSLLISGNISMTATGNFNLGGSGDGDIEISGVISGPGALFKSALSTGTLTLSNANNTYTDRTTVGAGTLKISSDGNLGAVPGAFDNDNVRIRGGASTLQTTATMTLNANRGIQLGTGGGSIRTDAATALTVNGVISGGAGDTLTKSGDGTLMLAAANTHAGPVQVNAGTLMVTNITGSGTGNGAVSVITGTLAGHHSGAGNIAGSVIIGTGSVLSPGSDTAQATHGVGTLKFTAVDLQSGSTGALNIDGAASFDRILVSATDGLALNGRIVVSTSLSGLAFDTAFAHGTSFDLLDWAGVLGGTFAVGDNLRDGSGDNASQFDLPDLAALGRLWDISNFLTNGTITVVPEPGRAILLGLGLAALLTRRHRASVLR